MKQQMRRDMILSAAFLRRKIFELKLSMIQGAATEAKMTEALEFFKNEDFQAVLEERACANLCGYPCCATPVNTRQPFCSDTCSQASCAFQEKLSDEYVPSRVAPQQYLSQKLQTTYEPHRSKAGDSTTPKKKHIRPKVRKRGIKMLDSPPPPKNAVTKSKGGAAKHATPAKEAGSSSSLSLYIANMSPEQLANAKKADDWFEREMESSPADDEEDDGEDRRSFNATRQSRQPSFEAAEEEDTKVRAKARERGPHKASRPQIWAKDGSMGIVEQSSTPAVEGGVLGDERTHSGKKSVFAQPAIVERTASDPPSRVFPTGAAAALKVEGHVIGAEQSGALKVNGTAPKISETHAGALAAQPPAAPMPWQKHAKTLFEGPEQEQEDDDDEEDEEDVDSDNDDDLAAMRTKARAALPHFTVVWHALATWVTRATRLHATAEAATDPPSSLGSTAHGLGLQPPMRMSELEVSRYENLLGLLRMHLPSAVKRLHVPADATPMLKTRLDHLVATFDLGRAVGSFSVRVWESIVLVLAHVLCHGFEVGEQPAAQSVPAAASNAPRMIGDDEFLRIPVELASNSDDDDCNDSRTAADSGRGASLQARSRQGVSQTRGGRIRACCLEAAAAREWQLSSALIELGLTVDELRVLLGSLRTSDEDREDPLEEQLPEEWLSGDGLSMMESAMSIARGID